MVGALERLLAADPKNQIHDTDNNISLNEAKALMDRDENGLIDQNDLSKINLDLKSPDEAMSSVDLAKLGELFRKEYSTSFPQTAEDLRSAAKRFVSDVGKTPKLFLGDEPGKGAKYQNHLRPDGTIIPDRTPQGSIVLEQHTLLEPLNDIRRKLDHELFHHRWDHATPQVKAEVIKAFKESYSLKKARDFLEGQDPTYGMRADARHKKFGTEASEDYIINECIAHMISYDDVPAQKALVNEPSPEEKRKLIKPIGSIDSEDQLKIEYEKMELPWHEAQTEDDARWISANRPDLSTEDHSYYDMQWRGLTIKTEFRKLLADRGLTIPPGLVDNYVEQAKTLKPQKAP